MSDTEAKPLLKSIESSKITEALVSTEPAVLSVEELNVSIKKLLEGQLSLVWVRGEISNFKAHTSGHFYFSLKDAKSQISAVMFRGHNSRLRFKPADGVEVIVRGRISVYEPRGNYQILCEMMEPVGAGALQRAFEQLKEKLRAEGLFEAARKRPIPTMPQHVAIVTSPTGAAIRDILNILSRRAPWLPVTLVPTLVQGEGSAEKIAEAFLKAQRLPNVDVIIVGRGGGSIEDLWAFNDEKLARLIAASPIPVISAVGHEIDFTISDFVADLRAPTPSAAAELVAKSSQELTHRLGQMMKSLNLSMQRFFKLREQKLQILAKSLVDPQKKLQDLILRNDDLLDRLQMAFSRILSERQYEVRLLRERLGTPQRQIEAKQQRLQFLQQNLHRSMNHQMERQQAAWSRLTGILDSLSPLRVVERGFAIVRKEGRILKEVSQAKAGDQIQITLDHGVLEARVEKVIPQELTKAKE